MHDIHIRSKLKQELFEHHKNAPDTLICDELGIGHGASRIDLAVISNVLHGYEIKSDRDTLARLPLQVKFYNTVFNKVTLVVGYRHAYEALKIVPLWWGVKLAHQNKNGEIIIEEARDPIENSTLDSIRIAKLLWKSEALDLLEQIGKSKGFKSRNRDDIYKHLANVVELEFLLLSVCNILRVRTNWKADSIRIPCGD